ncbi:hypothetical protein ABT007_00730 [Streptomyces griseus]|uniref:hypothetical protein n=1 Tax=Streptomyces griseus TaxID=1911 RepID=UPI00332181DB
MPKSPQHWTESLFDSVYALHETAREYQIADRAAQAAVDSVDFDRRRSHEGRIALEGRTNVYGGAYTRAPHDHALMVLSQTYRAAANEMRTRYEQAALLFASGAAWAVRSVHEGQQTPVVAFLTDEDHDAVPRALHVPNLDRYSERPALEAAYRAVSLCTQAAEYGEELGNRDDISEHEAGELHRAWGITNGTAEAAFSYGLLAQRALNFVLLEPRRAREREIALARASAQTDRPSEPSA